MHQDKARGPYQLSEKIAEDLYRLRSAKGEFGRDELAKRKAQEQRRFYEYQRKLKDTVLRFMQDGSDPYHALKLAKDLSIPPRGIDGYELNTDLLFPDGERHLARPASCATRLAQPQCPDRGEPRHPLNPMVGSCVALHHARRRLGARAGVGATYDVGSPRSLRIKRRPAP